MTRTISLSTNSNEICADSGYEIVYFYALSDIPANSLSLVDSDTNNVIATMVDDGNYSLSGDDMQGDGVFTCKLAVDISKERDYYYFAEYADSADPIRSNIVNFYVYEEFTDEELDEMAEVDDILEEWYKSTEFQSLSVTEKSRQTHVLLMELAEDGTETIPYSLIDEKSIYYDDDSFYFTFAYSCGVMGVFSLVESDDMLNGISDAGEKVTDDATTKLTLNSLSTGRTKDVGSALILYALQYYPFHIMLYLRNPWNI